MKEINTTTFCDKIKDYKPRGCLKEILEYIDGDSPLEGNILCLCGLEGTGKRTLMMQALEACKFKNEECLFLEAEDGDDLWKLYFELDDLLKIRGIKVIFIDEITRTSFLDDADELVSIAEKYKLRIVVSSNSPNILHYTTRNLYRRYKHMHDNDPWNEIEWYEKFSYSGTEDMTYAEYCRCFGPTSIETYVEYGGIMNKENVNSYCDAKRYVENCVADQILKLDALQWGFNTPENEPRAIGKICELLCGNVERKEYWNVFCDEFKVTSPSYESFDNNSSTKRKVILEPFVKILNATFPEKSIALTLFVRDVLDELQEADFLCETKNRVFVQSSEDENWNQRKEYEYHIKQNAIRYQCLKNDANQFWKDWKIGKKLIETINYEMIRKIVLFDTSRTLGYENYFFEKVSFIGKNRNDDYSDFDPHIIDMLVYDRNEKHHWAFSVSFGELKADTKTLIDPEFTKVTEDVYGPRVGNFILHDGDDYISDDGIHFLNTEQFLLTLDELKNITAVLEA